MFVYILRPAHTAVKCYSKNTAKLVFGQKKRGLHIMTCESPGFRMCSGSLSDHAARLSGSARRKPARVSPLFASPDACAPSQASGVKKTLLNIY